MAFKTWWNHTTLSFVYILHFSIRFSGNKSSKRPRDFGVLCKTWYHLVKVFCVYSIEVVVIMLKVISLWKWICLMWQTKNVTTLHGVYASFLTDNFRWDITRCVSRLPKAHYTVCIQASEGTLHGVYPGFRRHITRCVSRLPKAHETVCIQASEGTLHGVYPGFRRHITRCVSRLPMAHYTVCIRDSLPTASVLLTNSLSI